MTGSVTEPKRARLADPATIQTGFKSVEDALVQIAQALDQPGFRGVDHDTRDGVHRLINRARGQLDTLKKDVLE